MSYHSLPGPGDFCPGCNRLLCRCRPEPDPDALYDEAYDRGYDACLQDGYDNHPLATWPSDEAEAAMANDWVRLVSGGSLVGIDGRRFYGSNWFNVPGAWRHWGPYGRDPFRGEPCPEGYLAGFDDAGAGRAPVTTCSEERDGAAPVPSTSAPRFPLQGAEAAPGRTTTGTPRPGAGPGGEPDDGLPF